MSLASADGRRWLVTGGRGMLGTDLARALDGRDVTLLGRAELDITDADAVRAAVEGIDVIVNAAAYTKVDDAESHEEDALAVNGRGAGNLARAAGESGAHLVQLSTDYVFDGSATEPYAEDAPRHPLGAYGRTKAEGELQVLSANPERSWILRTAWLYGAGGPNFARTMVRAAGERETLSVVNDQIGQPTWTADLAAQIIRVVDADAPAGIYHATSGGRGSWFDFARAIFAEVGLDPDRVTPTTSAEYTRPAPRPAWSVLGHERWRQVGLAPIRDWKVALAAAAASGALTP